MSSFSIHSIDRALRLLVAMIFLATTPYMIAEAQSISVQLISTLDYPRPGSTFISTGQINDDGDYVGGLFHKGVVVGFAANTNGFFSKPFSEPDATGSTSPNGIKNGGGICGSYGSSNGTHGFFRRGLNYQTFDAPVQNVFETTIRSVNSANNFAGIYTVSGGSAAFAYAQIDGNFITLPVSGIAPESTGINNLDQVVGDYGDDNGNLFHGFFRATDGTLTMPIDFPGALHTVPQAINDSGYIVGFWFSESQAHAFVIQLPDTFVSYDLPGAKSTNFTGINNAGLICGTYSDAQFNSHILIAQLVVQ